MSCLQGMEFSVRGEWISVEKLYPDTGMDYQLTTMWRYKDLRYLIADSGGVEAFEPMYQ